MRKIRAINTVRTAVHMKTSAVRPSFHESVDWVLRFLQYKTASCNVSKLVSQYATI